MDTTRITYLDHAATSWPKPPEVAAAVAEALSGAGNPGRGAYSLSQAASRLIGQTRSSLAGLLGAPDASDVILTRGCTEALNLVLRGLLRPGDRVLVSPAEHNAVSRPLFALASMGVEVVSAKVDAAGTVDLEGVEAQLSATPFRAVVCQHASNVTGTIQPIQALADVAHAHGALLLVDGAQAGGHLPVDLAALGVDAWACSGHKGLLGPQGVGVLYLSPACDPEPLMTGGTSGGSGEAQSAPSQRPERYEPGTPNTPGIAGLGAAGRLLLRDGERIRAEEARLARRLQEGIAELGAFRILGPAPGEPRVPVVSVVHEHLAADELAFALEKRWGIACRAGLHCAPLAHGSLGTLTTGALRLSVGHGNRDEDVDLLLDALAELVRAPRGSAKAPSHGTSAAAATPALSPALVPALSPAPAPGPAPARAETSATRRSPAVAVAGEDGTRGAKFPVERPVTLHMNDVEIATIQATPAHLDELGVGFLLAEGLLTDRDALRFIEVDENAGHVFVESSEEVPDALIHGQRYVTSGCGKGVTFSSVGHAKGLDRVTAEVLVEPAALLDMVRQLSTDAEGRKDTGGVHGCALGRHDGLLLIREDIGRHNAVDKLLGRAWLDRIPTENLALFSTGRVSYEMAVKAAKARIPVVVTRHGVTDLAAEIAEHLGITLVAYCRGNEMVVCAHPWRVTSGDSGGKRPIQIERRARA